MITTAYALQAGGGNVREGNPLLAPFSRRPVALVATGTAINVLQLYTIAKVQRRHPKLARLWAAVLIGAEAYAVTNNLKVASQLHRARGTP